MTLSAPMTDPPSTSEAQALAQALRRGGLYCDELRSIAAAARTNRMDSSTLARFAGKLNLFLLASADTLEWGHSWADGGADLAWDAGAGGAKRSPCAPSSATLAKKSEAVRGSAGALAGSSAGPSSLERSPDGSSLSAPASTVSFDLSPARLSASRAHPFDGAETPPPPPLPAPSTAPTLADAAQLPALPAALEEIVHGLLDALAGACEVVSRGGSLGRVQAVLQAERVAVQYGSSLRDVELALRDLGSPLLDACRGSLPADVAEDAAGLPAQMEQAKFVDSDGAERLAWQLQRDLALMHAGAADRGVVARHLNALLRAARVPAEEARAWAAECRALAAAVHEAIAHGAVVDAFFYRQVLVCLVAQAGGLWRWAREGEEGEEDAPAGEEAHAGLESPKAPGTDALDPDAFSFDAPALPPRGSPRQAGLAPPCATPEAQPALHVLAGRSKEGADAGATPSPGGPASAAAPETPGETPPRCEAPLRRASSTAGAEEAEGGAAREEDEARVSEEASSSPWPPPSPSLPAGLECEPSIDALFAFVHAWFPRLSAAQPSPAPSPPAWLTPEEARHLLEALHDGVSCPPRSPAASSASPSSSSAMERRDASPQALDLQAAQACLRQSLAASGAPLAPAEPAGFPELAAGGARPASRHAPSSDDARGSGAGPPNPDCSPSSGTADPTGSLSPDDPRGLVAALGSSCSLVQFVAAVLLESVAENGGEAARVRLAALGAVPAALRALAAARDGAVRGVLAGVLRQLARDPGTRRAIADAGGVGALARLLQSGRAHARQAAARALSNVVVSSSASKAEAAQFGAIQALVRMLQADGAGGREAAAAALGNLAANSEQIAALVVRGGGVPALVSQLLHGSQLGAQHAARALRNLAGRDLAHKTVALESGAVPALIALLEAPGVPRSTRVAAASALSNIACNCEVAATAAVEAGAALPLLLMLRGPNPAEWPAGAEAAAWALSNLAATAQGREAVARERGWAEACAALLWDGGEGAKQAAARLVKNVAAGASVDERVALAQGADGAPALDAAPGGLLAPLVALLSSPTPSARRAAAAALWHLLQRCGPNRRAAASAGALPALLALLAPEEGDASRGEACRVLSALCAGNDCGQAEEAVRLGAAEAVVLVCRGGGGASAAAREAGAAVLAVLACARGNQAALVECGALEAMLELLQEEVPPATQEAAARGLGNIVAERLPQRLRGALLERCVHLLVLLAQKPAPAPAQAASRALSNICCADPAAQRMVALGPAPRVLVALAQSPLEELREAAAVALWDVTYDCEPGREAVVHAGGVPWLTELLLFGGPGTKEAAAACLAELAALGPAVAAGIAEAGAVPLLQRLAAPAADDGADPGAAAGSPRGSDGGGAGAGADVRLAAREALAALEANGGMTPVVLERRSVEEAGAKLAPARGAFAGRAGLASLGGAADAGRPLSHVSSLAQSEILGS